jgi:hypothetical protein
LPKDHPDGQKPVRTENVSTSLEFMADEAKVLIIFDYLLSTTKAMKFFSSLPKDSCVVHRGLSYSNNSGDVAAWVRSLQCPIKKNDTMEETSTKKFLISDWYTATGFEAPAVIIVTDVQIPNHPMFATHCMRAKAKLVVYSFREN